MSHHYLDEIYQFVDKTGLNELEYRSRLMKLVSLAMQQARDENVQYNKLKGEYETWKARAEKMFWLLRDDVTIGQIR